MQATSKLQLYLQAVFRLGSFNLRGLPLIPKSLFPCSPYNRSAYNEFIVWIDQLELESVSRVVDIGANHGDFAQAASCLFPSAEVILFEPLPDLKTELESRCQYYQPHWKLETCALGPKSTTMTLHIAQGSDAIGSLAGFSAEYLEANPQAKKVRQIECPVRPLDEIIKQQGIDKIDLLKIDVEGFEFSVLEGASQALQQTRAAIIEVSLIRAGESAESPLLRLLSLLQKSGLEIVNILPSWYDRKKPWQPVEFNVLARRR